MRGGFWPGDFDRMHEDADIEQLKLEARVRVERRADKRRACLRVVIACAVGIALIVIAAAVPSCRVSAQGVDWQALPLEERQRIIAERRRAAEAGRPPSGIVQEASGAGVRRVHDLDRRVTCWIAERDRDGQTYHGAVATGVAISCIADPPLEYGPVEAPGGGR